VDDSSGAVSSALGVLAAKAKGDRDGRGKEPLALEELDLGFNAIHTRQVGRPLW